MLKPRSVVIAAVAAAFVALPAAAQNFTMKLASVTQNDPLVEFMKLYKEKIEAATNGRIKAEVYPAAQLGGVPTLVQGLLLGTAEMFGSPPAFFKGADIRYTVTDAPGLFDTLEHGHATFTDPEFHDPFLAAGVAKGVKGVSFWNYGPTSYASTVPLRRLDDFKGKKIRVLASAIETGIMKELGAAGVPMDFAEVLPAMQNKTLDAVRSNAAVMAGMKFFTVTKFITNVRDTMIPCAGMVSTAFLGKLPADLRKAVEDVGRDIESDMLRVAKRFDDNAVQLWRDGGAEIIDLPPADKAEFMKRARSIGDHVLGDDPQTKEFYALLKRLAEKHRKKA